MEIAPDVSADLLDDDSDLIDAEPLAGPPAEPVVQPSADRAPAAESPAENAEVVPVPYNHGVTFLAPAYAQLGGYGAKCACGGDLPERTTEWIVYAEKWSMPICRRCAAHYPDLLQLAAKVNALNLPRSPAPPAIVPGERIANAICNRSGSSTSRRRLDLSFDWGLGAGRPILKAFGRSAPEWAVEQPELHALLDGTTYAPPVIPPPAPPTVAEIRSAKRANLRHQVALSLAGIDEQRRRADVTASAERLLSVFEQLADERVAAALDARKSARRGK